MKVIPWNILVALNLFYEASDSVCEKIISVNEDMGAQKQYRQERKDRRARW